MRILPAAVVFSLFTSLSHAAPVALDYDFKFCDHSSPARILGGDSKHHSTTFNWNESASHLFTVQRTSILGVLQIDLKGIFDLRHISLWFSKDFFKRGNDGLVSTNPGATIPGNGSGSGGKQASVFEPSPALLMIPGLAYLIFRRTRRNAKPD